MFDAISQTAKVGSPDNITPKTAPANLPDPSPAASAEQRQGKKAETKEAELSQEFLDALEKDIEMIHNIGLQFSVDHSSGRTIIRVFNKDTGKLIREVPPKGVLNLASKIDEMMGILFDKTV